MTEAEQEEILKKLEALSDKVEEGNRLLQEVIDEKEELKAENSKLKDALDSIYYAAKEALL